MLNKLIVFALALCCISKCVINKPDNNFKLVFEKPYVFISLGEGCKTAGYIRGSKLTSYSYPLTGYSVPISNLYTK